MSTRQILIVGATGKQGGAVIKALLASPPPFSYKILALTRNTTSPAAKALAASDPHIELLPGSLADPTAIFEQAGGKASIWGVFLMTIPQMGKKDAIEREQTQGFDLIDAAIAFEVKHFVFSSVERGGNDVSESTPTKIPHFVSKHNVEGHLRGKNTGMSWTILRPVAFMENLTPDFFGRTFAAMWRSMGEKKLQLVATRDIGVFAAKAFAGFEGDEYRNRAIGLVGDELSQEEGNEVFWRAMGRSMPRGYGFVGTLLQRMLPELGLMFNWFVEKGYGADVGHCKELNPEMMDFGTWLKDESAFKR